MPVTVLMTAAMKSGSGPGRPVGDGGMGRGRHSGEGAWSPAVDIFETTDTVEIVAELAGVGRDEVGVMVDGQVVRIYGQRRPTCNTSPCRFHRMEITPGSFVRSFRITVPIDASRAEAKADDGLLRVILPKLAASRTQQIKVETQ